MKVFACLLSFSLLSFSLSSLHADAHGGVHVRIPTCETVDDDLEPAPNFCMEMKPWYHHQHFDEFEEIEDQAYQLQDDTSWPGHREDFSDYLFRDKVFEQPL